MTTKVIRWILQHLNDLLTLSLFLLVLFLFIRKDTSLQSRTHQSDTLAIVKTLTDENGKLLAAIRTQQIVLGQSQLLIDSLSRALNVKAGQIRGVDRYIVRTDTVVRKQVSYIKSQDSIIISKADPYLNLHVVAKDSGTSYFSLKHTDTLWRISITRRPLFKAPYTEVLLRSASPYNSISHGSSFEIKSPRPVVTVGPYAGYDFISRRMSAGLSIQVPVIIFYNKLK